jgi:hypothetical protein
MKDSDFLDHQGDQTSSHKGPPRGHDVPATLAMRKNISFKGEEDLLVHAESQNGNGYNDMNRQASANQDGSSNFREML